MPNLVNDKSTNGSSINEPQYIAPIYIRSRHGSNAKPRPLKPLKSQGTIDIHYSELFYKDKSLTFLNKRKYLKQRKTIVKKLKEIVKENSLGIHTLFLAVLYFDIICSKMSSFDELTSIAKICLILSAKFSDDGHKAYRLEQSYRREISQNYQSDEMFIVKLLEYNLNQYSSYDIISQILNEGVVYDAETNDLRKVDLVHGTIEKIAMMLIESNVYIELSQSQIAFGIVGFAREMMKFEAYGLGLMTDYHLENNLEFYYEGLRKIQECFGGSVNGNAQQKRHHKQKLNQKQRENENLDMNNHNTMKSTIESAVI